jgi:hypothetical protein
MTLRARGLKTYDIRSNRMGQEYDIKRMTEKIQAIKEAATELKHLSGGMQAVDRNVDRILASVKMLEINISDIASII